MASGEKRIDRYEIEGVIGRGAMGVVYRANDPLIGRVIALKTLSLAGDPAHPSMRESLSRFSREARAAGLLSHPNIVTVYDVGVIGDDGIQYIAMEYVDGRTLRDVAPPGVEVPPDQVIEIAQQVARALDHAHRHGVVHRDVKPANILIRADGLVKLADFGVARIGFSDLTRSGYSVGSPSYVSPETLLDRPADGRADLFSLGIILYELLTGKKPFAGETIGALYHQILSATPALPSILRPVLAPDWDSVVMKLLAKTPEARYASAAHLLEDLRCIELGRQLRFAPPCEEEGLEALPAEDAVADLPDPVPDEVIQASISPGPEPSGWRPLPQQAKALLALLTVAGFAIVVMALATVARQAPPGTAPAGASRVTAPMATLTVLLEHNLASGRIGMTVDGKPVLTESIRGERSRMRTRGRMTRALEVPQGDHVYKVMVASDEGRTWVGTTAANLAAGGATLRIELKGVFGRDLDLTWQ